jgi:hypothetical protein
LPYVRLSVSSPKEGNREKVLAIEEELLAYFKTRPGFIEGYQLNSAYQLGRVTVWESQARADHVANDQHTLSLRSQLLPLVGDSLEYGFDGQKVA